MKKIVFVLVISCALGFLFSLETLARKVAPGQGCDGWGAQSPYNRLYDARTIETLCGVVVSAGSVEPMTGMGPGVELLVRTEQATVPVHLGPEWFVNNQDRRVLSNDRIEVKGSRVNCGGKAVIMASEIAKGVLVLRLRDEDGRPAWEGWKPRM